MAIPEHRQMRVRKYRGNPFRPRPELRVASKSRRHFPVGQAVGFCIRNSRCQNNWNCDACFKFSQWKEKA